MTKSYGKIYNDKKNVSITPLDIYNLYPVGSIYISVININPTTYFGGVWESFGDGRVLVGVDTSQTEFNTVMKTGGSKELQNHRHNITGNFMQDTGVSAAWGSPIQQTTGYTAQPKHINTDYFGNGDSGNLQPYITVYMWRRIS